MDPSNVHEQIQVMKYHNEWSRIQGDNAGTDAKTTDPNWTDISEHGRKVIGGVGWYDQEQIWYLFNSAVQGGYYHWVKIKRWW